MKILNTEYFDNPTGNVQDGVFLVKCDEGADVFHDSRGSISETFKVGKLSGMFEDLSWCKQINSSSSEQFAFRGFHVQTGEHCQGKLLECTLGKIRAVIIDFRPDSKTFGKYISVELTAISHDQLWIPRGFLSGVFSEETPPMSVGRLMNGGEQLRNALNQFVYLCDNTYCAESEAVINPYSFFARVEPSFVDDGIKKIKLLSAAGKLGISMKDGGGMDYSQTLAVISEDYQKYKRCWYVKNSCGSVSSEESEDEQTVSDDCEEKSRFSKKTRKPARKTSTKNGKRHK